MLQTTLGLAEIGGNPEIRTSGIHNDRESLIIDDDIGVVLGVSEVL